MHVSASEVSRIRQEPAESSASTVHRVRSVLAIGPFRRLWAVNSLCSVGDWLALLATTALATNLTTGYQAQSFAFGGVVAIKLLPALLLAPLAGALADKFDRRRLMVVCDVLRCLVLLSIPLAGSLWWLFVATFLLELCTLFWVPAKDASIPNLLRRPAQVETANQLSMVMTYGVSVVTASGLFTALTVLGPTLFLPLTPTQIVYFALVLNGLIYLTSSITLATRIPEISGRAGERAEQVRSASLLALIRDGLRFVGTTPLIRGLVIGIAGAFTAGGAVIACAKLYAVSLKGGDASYGLLFVSIFLGLGSGMVVAPKLSQRIPHNRLFGAAIVGAGAVLLLVAMAPHLWLALLAVIGVGASAGVAFLTGMTIIGARVEDEIRGRTVAFMQSLVRLVLMGSMALVPVLVGLLPPRTWNIFGAELTVDGTRPILFGAGIIAAVLGVIAYRQMDDRRSGPILSDLMSALRRPRRSSGLLIAVEGDTVADTSAQSQRLADWLRAEGQAVVLAADPAGEERKLLAEAGLHSPRAQVLMSAAVRADLVEQIVKPALEAGSVVVMERSVHGGLAELGAGAGMDAAELEGLAEFSTGRLAADVTVLLDKDPATPSANLAEQPWRMHRLLTEMAAAEPDRYVVVEAGGGVEEVAERVREAVRPVLAARQTSTPEQGLSAAEAG
ncbi:dTMP kinase [Crossiella cryophila]